MDTAPVDEMGVACLFAAWARANLLRIESIGTAFPNCIARIKGRGAERRVRIQFEFKSSGFRVRGHRAAECDWIVCWKHDWADCPKRLRVIELRTECVLGFDVWIQPVSDDTAAKYSSRLTRIGKRCEWTVASQARKGDLVLFYHSTPRKEIGDVFRLIGPVEVMQAGKRGFGWNSRTREWRARLERIAQLKSPVTLAHLKGHSALKDAWWVRNNLVSRANVTVDWAFMRELIVQRNPAIAKIALFAVPPS